MASLPPLTEEEKRSERYQDIEKHFLVYQEECARVNWLFTMRCKLIDTPTNFNMSFTNFIAIILCQNFIPWEANEPRENFINYGQLVVQNETSFGHKCRERILQDIKSLNLPDTHSSFHDTLMQWKVHFHRIKDTIVEYEKSTSKNEDKVHSDKMLAQISLLRTMIEQIGLEPEEPSGSAIEVSTQHERKLNLMFIECENCGSEVKKKGKTEEKPESHLPMQRLNEALVDLFFRYTKIHTNIKNTNINEKTEPPELSNDRDLPDDIRVLIKKVEEMIGKWKVIFRGEQAISYFNSAEYYLQHVLHLYKEYHIISTNLYGFRRVIYWKLKKITMKKDFVEHSKVVLKELAAVEETVLNIYAKTLTIPEKILKYDEEHGPFEWHENIDIVLEKLML